MTLEPYDRKRDFQKTPEPPAEEAEGGGDLYVIQKHDATRLHYDLRLECDGVLLSWAIPKGPSLNPSDRRLAVMVEDHPLDYAGFEGTIPDDEYGGGTVMVWDTGTFEQTGEVAMSQAAKDGFIEVRLHGKKLKGGWKLIRWERRGPNNWLLIKRKDEHADPSVQITKAQPDSALTGRSLEEIAREGAGES